MSIFTGRQIAAVLALKKERKVARWIRPEDEPMFAHCFEKDHYEVSIACGERVLLPEVRESSKDTLLIADGFSCREQIRQTTNRVALHTAQVLEMAVKQGSA